MCKSFLCAMKSGCKFYGTRGSCNTICPFMGKCENCTKKDECPEKTVTEKPAAASESSPDYYTHGGVSCLSFIRALVMHLKGEEAFYAGCVAKYLWRYRDKGGRKDIQKAITYLQKIDKILEEEECSKN